MSLAALIEAAKAVIAEADEQYRAADEDGESTAYCTVLSIPDLEGALDAIGDEDAAALAVGRAALAYERARRGPWHSGWPDSAEIQRARAAFLEALAAALAEDP